MGTPIGYDIGLTHSSVAGGAATGFLLDEDAAGGAFAEETAVLTHVDVTTGGAVSVASYGLGATLYRLRLRLRGDILKRNHQPVTETPDTLRLLLKSYAAITDGTVRLDTATLSRRVGFVEAVTFASGPGLDGYIAQVALVDIGA